jgi:enoyl-CoA hydratase/carnithine racemase
MEMILTGRLYDAQKAHTAGLVHRVAASVDLDSEAEKLLHSIFRNPQHAVSQAKLAVKAAQNRSFSEGLSIESANFGQCFKNDFFINLMCRQLEEGILKTTVELPDHICGERSPKP